ncbi:phosphoribosylamine--glycine ligase [Candidatus Haliotispira prima]|uniref:Phosphoribosylamine--glycine ligase n=1 Tax=Candidatus Haliotispira prima TaxID=3034016 RepID=A0ABY8MI24_9SPIO|nr:phosphoribosylamine--glycine ligase [Candidatus Haliotispira prima]
MKKILLVGGGGREHAIAHSIVTGSPNAEILFCQDCAIPRLLAGARLSLGTPLEVAQREAVDLVIVGPEAPLVAGLVDELETAGLTVFGPPQAAARLEGSKSFAKSFMGQYGVRTAACEVFEEGKAAAALQYLEQLDEADFPIVLKADGLAAGKGVLICEQRETALQGIRSLMEDRIFEGAGATVVIEEYLQGFEASVLAFCDGNSIRPMPGAKDHKKIFEGERGENTGGMGCVAPHPMFREGSVLWEDFEQNILQTTLQGIRDRGWDFCGIIFFGLIIQDEQCYLLEYNMRFGDPEAQTVLPLLDTPLLDIVQSCLMGRLAEQEIRWKDQSSCTVVAAAEHYPRSPVAGDLIEGLQVLPQQAGPQQAAPEKMETGPSSRLYLAGTCHKEGGFYTAGGRVLAWNATAPDLEQARFEAYRKLEAHPFRAMQYRRDIGGPIVELKK